MKDRFSSTTDDYVIVREGKTINPATGEEREKLEHRVPLPMRWPDWKFWNVAPRTIVVSYMMFFETEVGSELRIDGELCMVTAKIIDQQGEDRVSYQLVMQECISPMRVPGRRV